MEPYQSNESHEYSHDSPILEDVPQEYVPQFVSSEYEQEYVAPPRMPQTSGWGHHEEMASVHDEISLDNPSLYGQPARFGGSSNNSQPAVVATTSAENANSSNPSSSLFQAPIPAGTFTPVNFANIPKGEEQASPFDIKVRNPEKIGEGMQAYVRYSIVSKTTLPQYTQQELIVSRRYNDFIWLHEQLWSKNKGVIIPPLPEKLVNPLASKFSVEFLEFRRKELERFLNRVGAHPILRTSPDLQVFLSADEMAIATAQQEEPSVTVASHVFSFLGNKLSNIAQVGLPDVFGAQDNNEWFIAKTKYFDQLEKALHRLAENASSLSRRHKEFSYAFTDMEQAALQVSDCERSCSNGPLADAFKRLSEMSLQLHLFETELEDGISRHWDEEIRDYIRIIGSIKTSLDFRMKCLATYQQADRVLQTKHEKLMKGKSSAALTAEVDEAERKHNEAKERFEQISDSIQKELERFEQTKLKDVHKLFTLLTHMHVKHEVRVMDLWKRLLSELCE